MVIVRMRKWPKLVKIGGDENPYLLRWELFKREDKDWPRLFLHRFCRSDDDRALHDHPWWFISILIRGSYVEEYQDIDGTVKRRRRTAPSICYRPLSTRHRVILDHVFPEPPHRDDDWVWEAWDGQGAKSVWTIILTGRDVRGWGFWCKKTLLHQSGKHQENAEWFVPWRKFDGCE